MPKELTHWILAERALEGLNPAGPLAAALRDHHAIYLGGAVLPDTLMHLFKGPHARTALDLAHRFHDTAGNSFAPLIAAEGRFPDGLPPSLLSALLGVIAHIQADIVFHPLIFALSGRHDMAAHYRVETEIDCHFLHHGALPPVHRLDRLLSPPVSAALVRACQLLFDPFDQLPPAAYEQALRLHGRYQAMYDRLLWKLAVRCAALLPGSPCRSQRHLFYPLGKVRPAGFAAGGPIAWRHPVSGVPLRSSLHQLADDAVRRIRETFALIETAGSLAAGLSTVPGENLLTGMHGVGEENMVEIPAG